MSVPGRKNSTFSMRRSMLHPDGTLEDLNFLLN
jgi:hypothetical protein